MAAAGVFGDVCEVPDGVARAGVALSVRCGACGALLPEGLVAWLVARLTGRPLVIYSHGEELTTWRQAAKMRAMVWTYRHADLVIANSEFTRDGSSRLAWHQRKFRFSIRVSMWSGFVQACPVTI